jgi:hypothetical protein
MRSTHTHTRTRAHTHTHTHTHIYTVDEIMGLTTMYISTINIHILMGLARFSEHKAIITQCGQHTQLGKPNE